MTNGQLTQTPAAAPEGPSAWLQLTARLGDIGRSVGQLVNDGRAARRMAEPVRTVVKGSGVVPASGTLVVDLGGPAMGRMWSVRSLALSAASAVTGTLAGTAHWYVGNPAAYGPGEWCAPAAATLPDFQKVTRDSVDVTPTDRLFVVISGGTADQAALARAVILDFPRYAGHPTVEL